MTRLWGALQASGVKFQLAGPYLGDAWQGLDRLAASDAGFATPYGASSPEEDMAEYVSHLVVPDGPEGEASTCPRVRAAGSPFPPELAVPFAKVKILANLGLVDLDQEVACIGDPVIQGPEGIHLGDALSVTSSLKAGWLDADGGHFLAVTGDASPYRLLLRVLAPNNAALGLHRLDEIGLADFAAPHNALFLSHENLDRARTSAGGLVLVTSANEKKVEGAVLFLALRNAFGAVTDEFPISTFRVSSQ